MNAQDSSGQAWARHAPAPASPDPGSVEYTENLLSCMQERLGILQALRTLADSQATAAHAGDIDVALGHLSRKQGLLEDLQALQHRLSPYFQDAPDERVWQSSQRRQQCRQVVEAGKRLLQETLQLEKNCIDELTSRREAVAAQLQDGQDSILARTAYTADNLLVQSTLDIDDL